MLLALGGVKYSDEAVWGTAFQFYKAQALYPYAKTPVMVLSSDTDDDAADSEDTPTLTMAQKGHVVAQSGSLARYAVCSCPTRFIAAGVCIAAVRVWSTG